MNFRHPNGSRRYLRGLFLEESTDKSSVLYTLKERDYNGYPSLYLRYMEEADPTEYRFAVKYLENWSHWQELSQSDWFQVYISQWRQELSTKLRSQFITNLVALATTPDNPSHFAANKYLLEATEKPTGASKRGRPSRDEVRAELTRLAASKSQIDKDAERIGLN